MMIGLFLPAGLDAVVFLPFPAWSISKKSLSDFTRMVLNLAAAPLVDSIQKIVCRISVCSQSNGA